MFDANQQAAQRAFARQQEFQRQAHQQAMGAFAGTRQEAEPQHERFQRMSQQPLKQRRDKQRRDLQDANMRNQMNTPAGQAQNSSGGASGELRDEMLAWAQQNIGGSEEQVVAAANALVRAKAVGTSAEQAVSAARQAARDARRGSTLKASLHAPPGSIAGIAHGVQGPIVQFTGGRGTNLQVLKFDLQRPGTRDVRIQLRGILISGAIQDGDEVSVQAPPRGVGFIQADRVFNRSTNSWVRAEKGVRGMMAAQEQHLGKSLTRGWFLTAVIGTVFAVLFFIFIAVWLIPSFINGPSPF